jgi:type I restriction enzyme S subunit
MRSEEVPFRELVEFAIGGGWGSEDPSTAEDVAVTIIRGTDFERARARDLGACPRRYESVKRTAKRALSSGDIVLEISGGSPRTGQSTGRSLFITDDIVAEVDGIAIPASFCRRMSIDSAVAEPRFAYFLLQEMWQSGRARRYENQSTGISNFQFEHFLDEERVWLPDLDEQRRIVSMLAALDDKIDSNRQLARVLDDAAASLFRARFVDFVGVQEFEDSEIGRIPRGWHAGALTDLARFVNGKALRAPNKTSSLS